MYVRMYLGFVVLQLRVRGRVRDPRQLQRLRDRQVRHLHRPGALHRVDARVPAGGERGGLPPEPGEGLASARGRCG